MLLANNYSEAFNTKGSNQHNDLVTQIKSNLDLGCWDKVFMKINGAILSLQVNKMDKIPTLTKENVFSEIMNLERRYRALYFLY